mgnify:FL=1
MEHQFELHRIGYNFVHENGVNIDRKNGTDDYLLLYLKSNVTILTEEGEITTAEPSFILYEKGFHQKYYDREGPFINDWMHFEIEPYNQFFERLEIPFETPVVLTDNKVITDMLADLYVECFNVGEQHNYIMDKKASVLFHKFSDMYRITMNGSATTNKHLKELTEIRRKIHNYEFIPDGAEQVAEMLNISTSHCQHIYKEFFGISIHQDMIRGRIEHAAALIQTTDMSISEIAAACGYENLEHFSRQFKKVKGCAPKQYRKH